MDVIDSKGAAAAGRAARRYPALDAAGRAILHALLAHGPTRLQDLPRRWPLIRPHLPAFVARLAACGLVANGAGGGDAVELTALGRRVAHRSAGAGRPRPAWTATAQTSRPQDRR